MKIFCLPSLASPTGDVFTRGLPPDAFQLPPFKDKDAYRAWCNNPDTKHCFWNFTEAMIPGKRANAANPPAFIHGIIGEFDAKAPTDVNLPDDLPPAWICRTFSGHMRVVWPFAKPVAAEPPALLTAFYAVALRELKANKIAPGFEPGESSDPCKYFEAGSDWTPAGGSVIPESTLEGWLFKAADKVAWSSLVDCKVPIEKVRDECSARWPDKWPGGWSAFNVGSRGVRFWDGGDAASVLVTEAGLVCFTGESSFKSWGALLGADWLRRTNTDIIGSAVKDIHHDARSGKFWRQTSSAGWQGFNTDSTRDYLTKAGLSPRANKNESLTQVDQALLFIQDTKTVVYAGPVAGYPPGAITMCGNPILVNRGPVIPEPIAGECPTIMGLLTGMLGDGDQLNVFMGWCQAAFMSLRSGVHRPGQALAICGPKDCGKSLAQNHVITPLLGGRAGKAFRYMSGGTEFNADLIGCEHLMIEDDCGALDLRTRRALGGKIKDVSVNQVQSCHGKNKDAISVKPFWRLSITLNDEPENICVIPPLDDSLIDKIILLKAEPAAILRPGVSLEERAELEATIHAEIPAFAAMLLSWDVGEDWKSSRFGVRAYHHSDLLESLRALAPEDKLHEVIQVAGIFPIKKDLPEPWEGTDPELDQVLRGSNFADTVRRLLDWNNALPTYLGRLEKRKPDLYRRHRTNAKRGWVIHPDPDFAK